MLTSATALATAQGAQIALQLRAAATVEVRILNLAGRVVATLPAVALPAGTQTLLWDRCSLHGTRVPAGAYLVRCTAQAADGSQAQVMTTLQLR